ncbi:hypothetical protein ACQEUU_37685 [Nonomuraea sp. CA-218870]|uniref:hypothetical protein n=1 Tax=Nonomuraea sp. CA-218870 TaxID=3239998 RepID=UPI003D94E75F
MAYDLPEDLIALKRAFLAAETRLASLSETGSREDWQAAYQECQRLAVEIDRHPYWATVDNRHSAWMALQAAAKA